MLLKGNFKSKHTLPLALLVAVLAVVFLELGILGFGQVPSLDIVSVAKSKKISTGPLEPPQECLDKPDGYKKWSCFRPYFERITNEVSVNAAMAEAIKLNAQRVVSDCHHWSHFIGEASLEKHNFDMGKAFSSCTFGCSSGCFHGVMERYLRYETEPANVISKIKNMCDSIENWDRKRECVHGLGHGLLAHEYLPLRDAIDACNSLDSDWRSKCIGGLTMEYMDQYLLPNLDEEDFKRLFPRICDPIEAIGDMDLMEFCILQIAQGALDYTGYDIERSEKLCEELTQQKYIDNCKKRIKTTIIIERPSNIDARKFFENHQELLWSTELDAF